MVFIAILLALALERFYDWGHLRRWQWFDRYCQLLGPTVDRLSPPVQLAAWIVPLVVAVGIVEYILSGWLYGLPRFLFDFAILVYCFGPVNFWAQIFACLQAMQQGDAALADSRVKTAFPQLTANNPQSLHQAVIRAIFVEGNSRIFAVLFWFMVLGAMGAVLYRLAVLVNDNSKADSSWSAMTLDVLNWLPSRALGILFALGGHFVKVLTQWKKYAFQGLDINDTLLTETGIAALDFPANKPLPENGDAEKAALQLFDRALLIMLVIAALLVLVLP